MKKYTTPQVDILDMEMESTIMGTSATEHAYSVDATRDASSVNVGRNRGNAWSDFEGE